MDGQGRTKQEARVENKCTEQLPEPGIQSRNTWGFRYGSDAAITEKSVFLEVPWRNCRGRDPEIHLLKTENTRLRGQ